MNMDSSLCLSSSTVHFPLDDNTLEGESALQTPSNVVSPVVSEGHSSLAQSGGVKGSEDYVQWYDSKAAQKSRLMLNAELDWARDNLPSLYTYLTEHCSHLYQTPTGNTGVLKSMLTPEGFAASDPVQLPANHSALTLPSDIRNSSGCYLMYSAEQDSWYVGAAKGLETRLDLHYHVHNAGLKNGASLPFTQFTNEHGMDSLQWKPASVSANHYLDFVQKHPELAPNGQVHHILTHHSQYETRLVECSVKRYLDPSLCGKGEVSFPVNWSPFDERPTITDVRPFKVLTSDGMVLDMNSLSDGARILGTSRKTIEVVLNHDTSITCNGIGAKARLYEDGQPLITTSPYSNPYQVEDIDVGLDYYSLDPRYLYAYDSELNLKATFSNSSEAAKASGYGDDYYRISRYINKRWLEVVIGGVVTLLLFAQNPLVKGRTKAVVWVELATGISLSFFSINDLLAHIWYTGDASHFIKKHLKRGEELNGFKVYYATDAKGVLPSPTTVSKERKTDYNQKVFKVPKRQKNALKAF